LAKVHFASMFLMKGCCNNSLAIGLSLGSVAKQRVLRKSRAISERCMSGGRGGRARLLNS
jgi:hypothetical protein